MSRPTQKEIAQEIELLRALKPRLPKRNFFNESPQGNVEVQIDVLENNLSEDTIWNRCSEDDDIELEWTESERDAALEARRWLDGEAEESLSDNWKELAQ